MEGEFWSRNQFEDGLHFYQELKNFLNVIVGDENCGGMKKRAEGEITEKGSAREREREELLKKAWECCLECGFQNEEREEGEKERIVKEIAEKINIALNIIHDCLRLYGPDYTIGSFNGGKDAVCVLHLLRAGIAHSYDKMLGMGCGDQIGQGKGGEGISLDCWHAIIKGVHGDGGMKKPNFIFFDQSAEEFQEMEDFVNETEERYDIHLSRFETDFVTGLGQCILKNKGRQLAFVLGTRVGDPNCGTPAFFSPSSPWMPPFMRVNPIIYWDYGTVWFFLKFFQLPYCSLYDQGYTSIGKKSNTLQNSHLLHRSPPPITISNSTTPLPQLLQSAYSPAYKLHISHWDTERGARSVGTPRSA